MLPLVHVSPGMKFVDDTGRLLLDWPRQQEPGPQGWHESYRFHQPEFEQVLREGLKRFPCVALRLRTEVFALDEEQDAVVVRYEDLGTGELAKCRARYVVGCDGARSLIRRLMGAPMEDLGFHERWLVVDVLLKRPRPDLGDYSVQYCNGQRPATYVRGTGNRRRWEITILPGEDPTTMTQPAKVFELLKPWVGPEDAELERAAVYTFHSAVAPIWRSGRLLIAGDSAHLTPPFLGQGLCAGMRDAGNLGWKLARVLRDLNEDTLLDTYQTERAPHVREYIELAVRLGGLINTKALEAAVPRSVLEDGECVRMASIKPRLGTGVAGGWNGLAGQLAPQPQLADGIRLDDRVGYRFAAMLQREFAASLPGELFGRLADRQIIVVADDAPERQAWLQAAGASATLVRPDRYVLGEAHSQQELNALVAAV
jgi:3-(3-hydroxy-phenyl)propionate hydroxylase